MQTGQKRLSDNNNYMSLINDDEKELIVETDSYKDML